MHLILGGQDFKTDLGASLLRGLLESLRPARFDQIIVIDSGIDNASRALLRSESTLRRKQGLPKVEVYPFKWVNDFAAARNEALAHCTTDWWVWADGDDIIENADRIRAHIETADDDAGGFFATYLYAFDEYGNPITRHDRERVFRTRVGWEWAGRIHEVTIPQHSMAWQRIDDVIWTHQRSAVEDVVLCEEVYGPVLVAGRAPLGPRHLRLRSSVHLAEVADQGSEGQVGELHVTQEHRVGPEASQDPERQERLRVLRAVTPFMSCAGCRGARTTEARGSRWRHPSRLCPTRRPEIRPRSYRSRTSAHLPKRL